MNLKNIISTLLFCFFIISCGDTDESRLAIVNIEFSSLGEGIISDLSVPYFRMITENSGTIRSVYENPDGTSLNTSSLQLANLDGRIVYKVFAVTGPTESIDIGNSSNLISFSLPASDTIITLPICFPNSVPFDHPTDIVPGNTYTLKINLDLNEIHVIEGANILDARNSIALVEE